MNSNNLPSLKKANKKYDIPFNTFALLILHPVTTELYNLFDHTNALVDAVLESRMNYIAVYPNNDPGNDIIFSVYNNKLSASDRVKIFPSINFEHFLTFLKNASFVIGNSSLGIREAPFYGTPSINIGSRQNNRLTAEKIHKSVAHCEYDKGEILQLIKKFSERKIKYTPNKSFGRGDSDKKFLTILQRNTFWKTNIQKKFLDMSF